MVSIDRGSLGFLPVLELETIDLQRGGDWVNEDMQNVQMCLRSILKPSSSTKRKRL